MVGAGRNRMEKPCLLRQQGFFIGRTVAGSIKGWQSSLLLLFCRSGFARWCQL